MHLVLASASPRRRQLLAAAGIACLIDPVDVDERRRAGESPDAYVRRVAEDKARAGAVRHPAAAVLAADTAVVVDADVLGKPADALDAERMLRALAGRAHDVLTGVALVYGGRLTARVERTSVWMSPLSDAEIQSYVASREPMDKAGGYAIQGLASRFIPRIEGSYTNVVGLPVATVAEMLAEIRVLAQVAPKSG